MRGSLFYGNQASIFAFAEIVMVDKTLRNLQNPLVCRSCGVGEARAHLGADRRHRATTWRNTHEILPPILQPVTESAFPMASRLASGTLPSVPSQTPGLSRILPSTGTYLPEPDCVKAQAYAADYRSEATLVHTEKKVGDTDYHAVGVESDFPLWFFDWNGSVLVVSGQFPQSGDLTVLNRLVDSID